MRQKIVFYSSTTVSCCHISLNDSMANVLSLSGRDTCPYPTLLLHICGRGADTGICCLFTVLVITASQRENVCT